MHIKNLTIHPKVVMAFGKPPPPVVAATVKREYLVVPRAYGLQNFGPVSTYETIRKPDTVDRMRFHGKLNDENHQTEAMEAALDALKDRTRRSAVLCLPCGYGKTTTSLAIASRIGGRCLVLVHKSVLLTQWQERCKEFLPEATIGLIRGPLVESDRDVTIGMIQSVHSRDYGDAMCGYDLVIFDESHHTPCSTFLNAAGKIGAGAVLGLTATPYRADGLTDLMFAALGQIVFSAKRKHQVEATFRVIRVPCSANVREYKLRNSSQINFSKLISDVCYDDRRNDAIVQVIASLLEEDDRCVIVLGDRTKQLRYLFSALIKREIETKLIVGSTKQVDRVKALQSKVVLSTFALASEGLDKARLDTLVLASPKGDVTQAVGRIQREHAHKCPPLVIDFIDSVDSGVLHGLRAKRRRIMQEQGFTSTEM